MSRWEPMLELVARERYRSLVAHAMLLAGSLAEAEDLVQDALVTSFSARAKFASIGEAEHYVRRAVASRFIDATRRKARERTALVAALPDGGRVGVADGADVAALGLSTPLKTALATLSPRQRACVVLRHVEDLSTRETARVLGLSEGAVKRYLSDGVAALNAALGTTAATEEPHVVRISTKGVRRGS